MQALSVSFSRRSPRSVAVSAAAVLLLATASTAALARGGAGITGSQGAGARTGFGPPVGINPTPAEVANDTWPDAPIFSDGDRCYLRRKTFGSAGYVRICE